MLENAILSIQNIIMSLSPRQFDQDLKETVIILLRINITCMLYYTMDSKERILYDMFVKQNQEYINNISLKIYEHGIMYMNKKARKYFALHFAEMI